MIQCQNCGQVNGETSNFCRFCGTNFSLVQNSNAKTGGFDFLPPRPYSWKTDEFQVSEARVRKNKPINQVQPIPNQFAPPQPPRRPQPLAYREPQNVSYGYRCPRCASQFLPQVVRKISTAGWIVFAALMVTFFPLFWVGLLIKEDVKICPVCKMKIV